MFLKIVLLTLFSLLAVHVLRYLYQLDLHKPYHFKHMPGECRRVPGIEYGSEDFEVLSDGKVFISHGVSNEGAPASYKEFYRSKGIKGGIYLFNFNQPDSGAKEIPLKESPTFDAATFQPHGLSVLEDKVKGQHLVFVVNHPRGGSDTIEKFRYIPDSKELQHLQTYTDASFSLPNDVAATGTDSFYVVNTFYFSKSGLYILEHLLLLSWGTVLYYNGSHFEEVVSGLAGGNGLVVSKDGRFVYVNTMNGVSVFSRADTGSLTMSQIVDLDTHPDNSVVSLDGNTMFTGCGPNTYKILQFASDPRTKIPSQVLAFPIRDGQINKEDATELFFDDGDVISASSVAVVHKRKLLIGSVLDKLLLCDVTVPFKKK